MAKSERQPEFKSYPMGFKMADSSTLNSPQQDLPSQVSLEAVQEIQRLQRLLIGAVNKRLLDELRLSGPV